MGTLLQDLRYAIRLLLRAPGFAALAVLTLALGIGVNTAIFSIVSPVLFQPLPFPHPNQIIEVLHLYHGERQNGLHGSEAMFLAQHHPAFSAVSIVDALGEANLTGAGPAAHVLTHRVTHGFFDVFGIQPVLGRGFLPADDQPGASPTAVLTYAFWQSHFAGNPSVLGRALRLNQVPYTVIGVMPAGFSDFEQSFNGFNTDLWIDMQPTEAALSPLGPNLDLLARLRPGITLAQAQAQLNAAKSAFNQIHPQIAAHMQWGAQSYRESVVGDMRQPLWLLLGAVMLVLLIACANIANLLLARATARKREIAIRAALGANQGRLLRQLLTESLLLAFCGAALGWLLAWWTAPLLLRLTPADFALPISGALDLRVLGFTAALAVFTGVLFGLAPALQSGRLTLHDNLKDSAPAAAGGSRGARTRGALVVAEVALAFLLLTAASLLAASLLRLNDVNPGFDLHGILTAQTSLTGPRQTSDAAALQYSQAVIARLQQVPGVTAAASITGLPLTRAMNYPVVVPGHAEDRYSGDVEWRAISPGFFKTMGIRMHHGRDFTPADTASAPKVAIISQRFADYYWHGNALGQVLGVPDPTGHNTTQVQIVGVAADVRENGVDSPPPFTLYVPQAQVSDTLNALVNHWFALGFVIRGKGAGLVSAVHRAFTDADPNQPVYNIVSLAQLNGSALGRYDFMSLLLSVFAGLALLLGAIGIYGVLAYAVEQRTREIGIRMALGASRASVLRQFIGDGLKLAAIGLGLGLVAAIALTRLLSGFLFGVTPSDPRVMAIAAAGLFLLAWLACLQPAWRATRVDPLRALRQD